MKNFKRENLDVSILTQRGAPHMRVMNGKALLDEESKDMKFVENAPRGERSVEVGRTAHSRYVRRPDGMYTITLRLDGSCFQQRVDGIRYIQANFMVDDTTATAIASEARRIPPFFLMKLIIGGDVSWYVST